MSHSWKDTLYTLLRASIWRRTSWTILQELFLTLLSTPPGQLRFYQNFFKHFCNLFSVQTVYTHSSALFQIHWNPLVVGTKISCNMACIYLGVFFVSTQNIPQNDKDSHFLFHRKMIKFLFNVDRLFILALHPPTTSIFYRKSGLWIVVLRYTFQKLLPGVSRSSFPFANDTVSIIY